jgi:hypothetical protein
VLAEKAFRVAKTCTNSECSFPKEVTFILLITQTYFSSPIPRDMQAGGLVL